MAASRSSGFSLIEVLVALAIVAVALAAATRTAAVAVRSVETVKMTRLAGFELGTGFFINPTPPEDAARFLRQAGASGAPSA